MIHLALVVLAALFLARVGVGLVIGTVVYFEERPGLAKRVGAILGAVAVVLVCLLWWSVSPAGFGAAVTWAAIIGLVIFVWRRLERRRP